MTVYIESNFVLEQALQQEECNSCAKLIDLASNGRISLVVPAFSLAEPHVAILAKEKARSRLSQVETSSRSPGNLRGVNIGSDCQRSV